MAPVLWPAVWEEFTDIGVNKVHLRLWYKVQANREKTGTNIPFHNLFFKFAEFFYHILSSAMH